MDFSYLTLMESIKLNDDKTSWIHVLPLGSYEHPRYGTIEVTPERVQNFADNVNNNVRGIPLDVDYEHKNSVHGGKAAGWIKEAKPQNNGLWAKVEWTDSAAEAISKKEYRFFSPEFNDSWKDAKGINHKDVLFGGGLTNRPFLKDLTPVNLSEFYTKEEITNLNTQEKSGKIEFEVINNTVTIPLTEYPYYQVVETDTTNTIVLSKVEPEIGKEGVIMEEFLKKLAEALGLESLTEEDAIAAIVKLAEDKTKLADENATLKKDPEPESKKFAEEYPEEFKRMQDLEVANKLAEINGHIKDWEGDGLPPKFEDEIRELRLSLSEEQSSKFDGIVTELVKDGLVDTSERGSEKGADAELSEQFEAEVKKIMDEADNKLSYRDAMDKVADEKPELAKAYYNK